MFGGLTTLRRYRIRMDSKCPKYIRANHAQKVASGFADRQFRRFLKMTVQRIAMEDRGWLRIPFSPP